ncbi:MAG: 2-aminoethylphosphonate--pyruvate transaminase [Neisseriaceae bacterium]|nr:2-aminoethylphosphonate--pyruvate transaminase [Neisseriaceae bacterium]MBP6860936.1 2-aminoethylphosphonate--pyruvate transaminase [Neisseriaceae bacterium]
MLAYKLLTPGPLTTTDSVKAAMLVDHCTWDEDYKVITRDIRQQLLALAQAPISDYTAILMQGSGSFGVESVLTSVIKADETVLVASNGAYGERIVEILNYAKIPHVLLAQPYDQPIDAAQVEAKLNQHPEIKHVVMVHCETTTGILNDIEAVGKVVHAQDKTFIVDAMSSFGGIDIPMAAWHIDYLISSANKCIQGVPGFAFILAKRSQLAASKGHARSLSLDLHAQHDAMEQDGKWRFTSPTHTVLAFAQALKELAAEGGVAARHQRYAHNNALMREKLAEVNIHPYLKPEHQSPFISTFLFPNDDFDFNQMYAYVKERGYAIYPGKLTEVDTFRLGNIGEIYPEDVARVADIIKAFIQE